jgi:hypothetical protein
VNIIKESHQICGKSPKIFEFFPFAWLFCNEVDIIIHSGYRASMVWQRFSGWTGTGRRWEGAGLEVPGV